MRFRIPFLATVLLAALGVARADTFRYSFSVTDLSNGAADFTLNVDTDGLITRTGSQTLATPLPTSLGFAVTGFGENASGWYAFSGDGGSIYDTGLIYSDEFFDFIPAAFAPGYDVAGTYMGSVSGNNPNEFSAHASLTITDLTTTSSATPEPASLCLLGTGLLGSALLFRRRALTLAT